MEASPRVVPGGWTGQGWAGSGPITGVKQTWGQDICQDSQHCLTRGACVQAHLYNFHVGFSPGDPEVLQVWHRGRGGSCSRQLRGDDIALGSPIAKVTSQLGHLLIDLGQVTYLRVSVSSCAVVVVRVLQVTRLKDSVESLSQAWSVVNKCVGNSC